jgi:TatD DNase family protein
MYIDTHAHLNLREFINDADQVIQRTLAEDTWLINVGADYKTSKRALDYANKYEKGVYAAIGLHPMHLFKYRAQSEDYDFTTRGEEFNYDIYEKLAKFEKVVAIGEVGLDFYHMDIGEDTAKIKKTQKEVLWQQILLARRLNLPLILHCRQAYDELIELLKEFKKEHRDLIDPNKPWGVKHCFSGTEDQAWKLFDLGIIVSFTGLITFSRQWDDLIRKIPNDKFMIETDCPFLTPEPHRGKRNEPLYVKYVAQRIGELKNLKTERIGEISTQNARLFFNI